MTKAERERGYMEARRKYLNQKSGLNWLQEVELRCLEEELGKVKNEVT